MGTLSADQIARLGFATVGTDVAISDKCSIYGASSISIGSHVRIDDFSIITARQPVFIGSYVHISAFAFLSGSFGITIEDFVNVSPGATLLSGNDDFSGEWLAGPLVPDALRNVHSGTIHLRRYCMVGANAVVLPGISFGEGAVVGALSLVKENLEPWGIYAGVPARLIQPRSHRAEELAGRLRGSGA